MEIPISSRSNLIVKVFVIGYSLRGESIMILFLDQGNDNKVLYSIVIDSFKYKREHKILDFMDEYNLNEQKLNMLVWSHPDYDHTYGLNEIIRKYCNENTQVVLPYGMTGEDWNKISFNREDKKLVKSVEELTKRRKLSFESASVSQGGINSLNQLVLRDYFGILEIGFATLSPHSSKINYLRQNQQEIKKNSFSISMLIQIGNGAKYNLLFLADTENEEIDMMYSQALERPLLVKIPHHTSSTSNHLPERISEINTDNKPLLACTTIYKFHKLPEPELLQLYKDLFIQTDWTGTSNSKNINYGCIEYSFDLYDKRCVEVSHHGHASIVDDNCMEKINNTFKKK